MMQRLSFVLMALMLTACGSLIELPGSGAPPKLYSLNAAADFDPPAQMQDWRILVDEPMASRAIDTDRIAVRPSDIEIKYYANARWSDRAPRLVQNLLIESLENSGAVELAGRGPSGLRAQYLLSGSLVDFQTEYQSGDAVVHIRLKLNLVEQKSGRVLAAKTFEQTQETGVQTRSVIMTFNDVFGLIQKEAVTWALDVIATTS